MSGAPGRDALVRLGVGIGPIRLDVTYGQVLAALGRPDHLLYRSRRDAAGRVYARYAWGFGPDWTVAVDGRGRAARVVEVTTTLRRERTRHGIGIGSGEGDVRRKLRTRCHVGELDSGYPNFMACWLGKRGRPVTMFSLASKCRVPDDRYTTCPRAKTAWTVVEISMWSPRGLALGGVRPRYP